jgi:hypothetical protein
VALAVTHGKVTAFEAERSHSITYADIQSWLSKLIGGELTPHAMKINLPVPSPELDHS